MLALAFNIQPIKAEPQTIVVPDDYPTIQGAINAANPGDTIFVRSGTYDSVIVNKTISLVGENTITTIIDGKRRGNVLTVTKGNVTITGFTIRNSMYEWGYAGINLIDVTQSNITKNIITENFYGIKLYGYRNNAVYGNIITGNYMGIRLEYSRNNAIYGNSLSNNYRGIYFDTSSNNAIYGNSLSNNYYGIYLVDSSNNTLRNNSLTGGAYNFGVYGTWLSTFIHDVDTSNTVDGKPIYYWINKKDVTVPIDAGWVVLVNSTNIVVRNLNLKNNAQGLVLAYTENSRITQNNISANGHGVYFFYSANNSIFENSITNNGSGIYFDVSSNNHISENSITNNENGVELHSEGNPPYRQSSNNSISGNSITAKSVGIFIGSNSKNNSIFKNSITNNKYGIVLSGDSNSLVRNSITSNYNGIYAGVAPKKNVIIENNITNNVNGVWLLLSFNNTFYHNNFIDNSQQVYVEKTPPPPYVSGVWDDDYPSGGNYWSDYTGVDNCSGPNQDLPGSDGIGDTPYVIDANNRDKYPLMKPWTPTPPIQSWSFDSDFQYNLDDDYETVEGTGHLSGSATLSDGNLSIEGQVTINGPLPSAIPEVYLIATDGQDRELSKKIVDFTYFSYWQKGPNTYGFSGTVPDAPQPINNGHYEVSALITYGGTKYEFFINTVSLINSHYFPLWTPALVNQPPTCVIKLQKNGVEISEVDVGEFFDIYVGDSTDDKGIKQVRFSSDDIRDGIPTGTWTQWYDWDISSGDWDTVTKIKQWAFATPGHKEIWTEVKDDAGLMDKSFAFIDANLPENIIATITSPLTILSSSPYYPYRVGDSLMATFSITNKMNVHVTFDILVVGGRGPDGEIVDFDKIYGVTLSPCGNPGDTYDYQGYLTLPDKPGIYHFFCAYYIENPTDEEKKSLDENNWNTNIAVELDGRLLSDFEAMKYRERIIIVSEKAEFISAPPPRLWEEIHGPWEKDLGNLRYCILQVVTPPTQPETIYVLIRYSKPSIFNAFYYEPVRDEIFKLSNSEWEKLGEGLPSIGVNTIAISPSDQNVIYAGTGQGVYKSIDGGKTWHSLNGPNIGWWIFKHPASIISLAVSPYDPNTVYAGTQGDGFWKKKEGENWKKISPSYNVAHIIRTPLANIVYASGCSVNEIGFVSPTGILKSENGGSSWMSKWTKGIVTDIAYSRNDKEIVFVSTGSYPTNIPFGIPGFTDVTFITVPVFADTIIRYDGEGDWSDGNFWHEATGNGGKNPLPEGGYTSLAVHPEFPNMVFTVVSGKGIYYSFNYGHDWFPLGLEGLGKSYINSIVLGSDTKSQILYAYGSTCLFKLKLSSTAVILREYSAGQLRVYDSEGRITGLINGEIKEEIPNSLYDNSSKTIIIFYPSDSYRYEVEGVQEELYGLTIINVTEYGFMSFSGTDIPIATNVIHQYTVNWSALSLGEEGVTVMVDADGDGVFEQSFTTGNVLSGDEFVLKTESIVDLDPDSLNLRSRGRWVTAYIEFPEGYDVADINVSTIMLNGTVPAELCPTAIGDYDNDTIPDLMVKFDRAKLISYILANVNMTQLIEERSMTVTLTITGKLKNGTPFQGSDTIKIIYMVRCGGGRFII